MAYVLITAAPRDRAAAEALNHQFAGGPYQAETALASDLVAEVKRFAKQGAGRTGRAPRLDAADAVVVLWSRQTVANQDLIEVARTALVEGARLIPVAIGDDLPAAPFPNLPCVDLTGWDRQSADARGLNELADRVSRVTTPPPPTHPPVLEGRTAKAHKRIVLFCDGTWQSLGAGQRTNVSQAAMAVNRLGTDNVHQITFYDDGVGAKERGFDRLITGAYGRGLNDRILAAYRFLTLNYEQGDEIYMFGFSRGAYTVRSLAGLMRTCGILRREFAFREEEAMALYRSRANVDSNGLPLPPASRDFKEALAFREAYARAWVRIEGSDPDPHSRDKLTIRYVGVWDTVGSLGIPSTLSKGKFNFHDVSLGRWVEHARQALALDEQRNAFSPAAWDNVGPHAVRQGVRHPTAEQLWFAGDHGGVGGGDRREGLSNVPLRWIIEGAAAQGLSFKHEMLERLRLPIDPITPKAAPWKWTNLLYTVRGFGWRQGPAAPSDIHDSVWKRWHAVKSYRPKPLKTVAKDMKTIPE
jgi:uncharacterized protein (DUF2235 family)